MPYSRGMVRAARTCCSTPQKWKCSIVRWVRFWPRGIGEGSLRRSTSTVRTPRCPNSIASPSPTGPPPTMATCASPSSSLWRNAGILDHLGPTRLVADHHVGKPSRGATARLQALLGERIANGRLLQDIVDLGVVAGDDLGA